MVFRAGTLDRVMVVMGRARRTRRNVTVRELGVTLLLCVGERGVRMTVVRGEAHVLDIHEGIDELVVRRRRGVGGSSQRIITEVLLRQVVRLGRIERRGRYRRHRLSIVVREHRRCALNVANGAVGVRVRIKELLERRVVVEWDAKQVKLGFEVLDGGCWDVREAVEE